MKFTSEDLLKAMGLKDGNNIKVEDDNRVFEVVSEGKELYLVGDLRKLNFINMVLNKNFEIISPKPTLTEDEKVILRNLPKEYLKGYITRGHGEGELVIYLEKPNRNEKQKWWGGAIGRLFNYDHLFQFIKWEDEPYSIEELLKE